MISALICTHGKSAPALLSSAEMICGKQKNTAVVNFENGENLTDLKNELFKKLEILNTTDGVIFFVDLKGGTPFNSVFEVINDLEEIKNSSIITGVNVAMLIEFFIKRESKLSFQKLLFDVEKNGKKSVGIVYPQKVFMDEDETF